MHLIPSEALKVEILGSDVDFFKLEKDGQSIYYFDTSKCVLSDPMVSSVRGLKLIRGTYSKLVMINNFRY